MLSGIVVEIVLLEEIETFRLTLLPSTFAPLSFSLSLHLSLLSNLLFFPPSIPLISPFLFLPPYFISVHLQPSLYLFLSYYLSFPNILPPSLFFLLFLFPLSPFLYLSTSLKPSVSFPSFLYLD